MITTVQCQHCNKGFESDMESKTEFCPHCGNETYVANTKTIPAPYRAPVPFPWQGFLKFSLLGLLAIGIIISLAYACHQNPELLGQLGAGGVSMVAAIIACTFLVIGLILTVFWVIFPWMVWSKANEVLRVLEKIEVNTRDK